MSTVREHGLPATDAAAVKKPFLEMIFLVVL
jgi:hypothetical protein